jgi:hypothetical protein
MGIYSWICYTMHCNDYCYTNLLSRVSNYSTIIITLCMFTISHTASVFLHVYVKQAFCLRTAYRLIKCDIVSLLMTRVTRYQ